MKRPHKPAPVDPLDIEEHAASIRGRQGAAARADRRGDAAGGQPRERTPVSVQIQKRSVLRDVG
jgi:hypothetical protein